MNYSIIIITFLYAMTVSGASDGQSKQAVKKAAKTVDAIVVKLSTEGDNIAFDRKEIKVAYAKTITMNFINLATMESEILHNVAIVKPEHEKAVLAKLQKVQYDLSKLKDESNILAISEPLKPGEKAAVSFNPDPGGSYVYFCLMPGHADVLNMRGTLQIEKK